MSPESSHTFHATKDKHQLACTTESNKYSGSRNGVKARKKKKKSYEVKHAQRARAPPTCTYLIHGRWAIGQGFQKVWFGGREKNGSILGFPLKLLWERCPVGMASHPKEVSMGWNHLMHVIEVGDEKF